MRRALAGDGSPKCLPYHAHEMLAHEVDRGAVDWAALRVSGAEWSDLDPLEFERLRQMAGSTSGGADRILGTLADREITSALGFTRHDAEVTTGALLLFGKVDAIRRFLPTHEAAFQVMRGLEVEVNDFLPHPLLRLAEEMLTRFRARNSEAEADFGMLRVAVPAYSETAFREALANALVHRDYTRRGAVHAQWSEDQLEISSPGGFPAGIRVDNLLVAPPHPRSPLLADAFKRAGLVERTGRGVNRMFAEQLRVGRPAPDYGRTSDDHVVAILPGGPANMSMTKWVLEQENQQGAPLRVQELQVLAELLRERPRLPTESFDALWNFRLRGNNRPQVRYLLSRLTAYVEVGLGKQDESARYIDGSQWHIEHLWPVTQELREQDRMDSMEFKLARSRIGALTLLPGRDNEAYQDLPFTEKAKHYGRQPNLTAIFSQGHLFRNNTAKEFAIRNGITDFFHDFGPAAPITEVIKSRTALYQGLANRVWNPVRIGFPAKASAQSEAPESPGHSQKRSPSPKPSPQAALTRLVKAGVIPPNSQLIARAGDYSATVDKNGIIWLPTGDAFNAVDEAGKAVSGEKRCDGLNFWQVQTAEGLQSLRVIRDHAQSSGRLNSKARRP